MSKALRVRARAQTTWTLLKRAAQRWLRQDAEVRAAALAFYAIFSAAPSLALLAGLLGLLLGPQEAQDSLAAWVSREIHPEVAQTLRRAMVASLDQDAQASWWAPLVGFGVIAYASTRFFAQLQAALNSLWGVRAPETHVVLDFLRQRAVALGMVLGMGLTTLLSLILSAMSLAVMRVVGAHVPAVTLLAPSLDLMITWLVMALAFSVLFKVVPHVQLTWPVAARGGAWTSALFTLGKLALSFYLVRFNPGDAFGAASAILVFLVWIFYSCQILFFGAALTRVYAEHQGDALRPKRGACALGLDEREA